MKHEHGSDKQLVPLENKEVQEAEEKERERRREILIEEAMASLLSCAFTV